MKKHKNYNTTQLYPEKCLEKHVFHRDQFAHIFRWSHVLKRAELGINILDVGCGSGNLAELLYRNRYKANLYLGLDIKKQLIEANKEKFKNVQWVNFSCVDLLLDCWPPPVDYQLIFCGEVFEHIGKQYGTALLSKIVENMSSGTTLLVSTPCYDPKVGAADNHVIDGEVGEYTYQEFKTLLETRLTITNHWGTFASKKDYKKLIPADLKPWFDRLNEYYDDNLISNLMAPLFPEHSRNVLWECIIK